MKKFIFGLLMLASPVDAAIDVREVGSGCVAGTVSVSTQTATAIPVTALSGRYRIDIINYDATYAVAIGTHSALLFANGFVLTSTTTASATSTVNMRVPSGFTVYGIGEGNDIRGTVNVRYLECK